VRRQYLAGALAKRGRALLHQQCWLWGHDIRREGGNLLLAYGFERTRPPEGVSGSSQYTLCLSNDQHLRLWGFGFYFGAVSGIYVNRYDFVPRETRLKGLWVAQEMSRLSRAKEFSLLPQALRQIASYEAWVARTLGAEYRAKCLVDWEDAESKSGRISQDWIELADAIERHLQVQAGLCLRDECRSGSLVSAGDSTSGSRSNCRRGRTRGQSRESRAAASA
jgi:hypothetical protein